MDSGNPFVRHVSADKALARPVMHHHATTPQRYQSPRMQHSLPPNPPQQPKSAPKKHRALGGIGLSMDLTANGDFVAASIKPGGSADNAGLKAGTIVHAVNGKPLNGLEMKAVRSLIVGPEGTTVRLTVEPPGKDMVDVMVPRTVGTDALGSGQHVHGGTVRSEKQHSAAIQDVMHADASARGSDSPRARVRAWLSQMQGPLDEPRHALGEEEEVLTFPMGSRRQAESAPVPQTITTAPDPSDPANFDQDAQLQQILDDRIREAVQEALTEIYEEEEQRLAQTERQLNALSDTIGAALVGFRQHLVAMETDRVERVKMQQHLANLSQQVDSLLERHLSLPPSDASQQFSDGNAH